MPTDKKITKEDTWRPADLRRHIREEERVGDHVRRRDDYDRNHRGGESTERRHRDPEESRREKERLMERESTRERRDEEKKDRKKEGSQDRRADREKERRDEREREKKREKERLVDVSKYGSDYRQNKERRQDREERHDKERDKERHRDKEKERVRDSDRYNEERIHQRERNKRGEYGAKERKREDQDREQRADRARRRHEESWDGRRDQIEKHHREEKDRHREREGRKSEYEDKRNDKEEKRGDRKHSEQKEDREYKEEHRKYKEERERRHRETGHRDEKQKHDGEFREHQGEEIRHHRGDRDRADRDKHKERRHKEEEDPERKHRERRHKDEGDVERKHRERRHRGDEDQRDKRSSSGKSQVPERNVVETEQVDMVSEQWIAAVKHEGDTEEPVVNDEDLANQEYEDDFEDYEEDFEELNESTNEDEDEKETLHPQAVEEKEELSAQQRKEMEAIQRAMDEENKRVGTAQSRQSTWREEEEEERSKWSKDTETIQSRGSQRGKFIDFVAAKQREVSKKVADKQKKRSTELLRLIDLDFSMTFSLLDLPPVKEYDLYIRSFGNANTKQAYVQCNEDNADRDIQTEEIEMSEKWTQHPPEHSGACGDPNFSQDSRYRSEMNFDSQRLASFLCSASQVMVVLLEEDQAARKSVQKLSAQSDMQSFSDGSLQLNTKLPFLYGRQISMLHFSPVQKHTMMSVHMPTTKPSAMALDSCTIICIWNIWEPSRPQRILVYESEIQCCCFSPGKATMVFAGTSVGSVVLWDLREQASNHYCLKMGEEDWTFRQPTFSTDAVMAASGHFSSVSSVEVVPSALTGGLRPDIPLLASEEESSGLSFQLASLDESGVLNFWVVVELPKGNEAGSPSDLGLRPGGKVKLLHSSSLLTAERGSPRDVVKRGPLHTLLLKFLPTDSNHFFIGTNMGLVHHGTSHGLKAPPKFYRFQEKEVQPVDVTSIHFSPFRPHLFLVGCGNGSIRLHAVIHEQPVAQWKNSTAGEPVVSLQWAQTRPTVFCVLDAASNLHIWDLLKNDAQPVVTEAMNSDRVTAMAVFGDAGKQSTYSGVALAHESGKIEMQYFKRGLTVSCSVEEEKLLESLMTEAF